MRFFKRLRRRESGQALVEYAIIIALVSVVVIFSLKNVGGKVVDVFEGVSGEIAMVEDNDDELDDDDTFDGATLILNYGGRAPAETVRSTDSTMLDAVDIGDNYMYKFPTSYLPIRADLEDGRYEIEVFSSQGDRLDVDIFIDGLAFEDGGQSEGVEQPDVVNNFLIPVINEESGLEVIIGSPSYFFWAFGDVDGSDDWFLGDAAWFVFSSVELDKIVVTNTSGVSFDDSVGSVDEMELIWDLTGYREEGRFANLDEPKSSVDARYENGRYVYEFKDMGFIPDPYYKWGFDVVDSNGREVAFEGWSPNSGSPEPLRMSIVDGDKRFIIRLYAYAENNGVINWVIHSNRPLKRGDWFEGPA